MSRTVVWFSAGAASAVAAKLTLTSTPDAVIAYVDPGSEHEDNPRFIADCEQWFDHEVVRLRSDRYKDTWQVWEERPQRSQRHSHSNYSTLLVFRKAKP